MRHKAVRASQNIVDAPWAGAFSSMTTLTSWEARPGILKETSSDTLCSAQEVDKGQTVTGKALLCVFKGLNLTMYEFKELVKNPTS